MKLKVHQSMKMWGRSKWALLLLALFWSQVAQSQFHQYRNYDVKDGLPSSEVYSMLQDNSGYLWFSTDMGASRFDGYEFKNFNTGNGMPDNTIFGLQEDGKGRIWFTSFTGKLSYYQNDRIYTLPCNAKLEQLMKGTFISSLYVDSGDTIWAGTTQNFAIRIAPGWNDAQVGTVKFPNDEGYLCLLDNTGFIYGGGFVTRDRISIYHGTGNKLYSLNLPLGTGTGSGVRYSITRMNNGNFLMTANNRIISFNSTGILAQQVMESVGICALEASDGRILGGTYNGVYSWSDNNFKNGERISKFNQKIVTSIFCDRENDLWYCTEGNGAWCIAHSRFLYYTVQDGIADSKISCVDINGSKVLAGHLDGTISILEGTSVTSMVPEDKNAFPGQPNRITSILSLNDHEAFVTTSNAFYRLNSFQRTARIIGKGYKKVIKSRDENFWSLCYNKLVKFDASGGVLEEVPFGLFADNIYEDRFGKLWICAVNGLWTYDKAVGLIHLGETDTLLRARIVDLKETTDGILWMVSRGGGLIVKDGNTYHHITQENGLAGNMCRCVFADHNNVVWVGSNNGLSKITYSITNGFDYTVTSYSAQDGLLTNEVNSIIEVDDKLWTIHTNGISVFESSSLDGAPTAPPVYLTTTLVNGDTVHEGTNQFEYDRNYFTISFIGLSFQNPGHITYRYKMEGVDNDWISTAYTSVQYQTLPPGEYRFLVQASSNKGYWSEAPATLTFVILPAWWQTWMFKCVAAAILLSLLLLLFRWRVQNIRKRDHKKAVLQNRIATFELHALRAQMNPHFVFNAINSVQYFITNNDPDSSQKYLSKFAKLIRYVVDHSKLISIPVRKEIEAVTLYLELEALRFGTRLDYTIDVGSDIDADYVQIPSMLIQPYVENAIWHGIMHKKGNGVIKISLAKQGKAIRCTIEDNGIGRQRSRELKQDIQNAKHKSVGMTNTQERLEIINQVNNSDMSVGIADLHDASGNATGTRVEIYIPIA